MVTVDCCHHCVVSAPGTHGQNLGWCLDVSLPRLSRKPWEADVGVGIVELLSVPEGAPWLEEAAALALATGARRGGASCGWCEVSELEYGTAGIVLRRL